MHDIAGTPGNQTGDADAAYDVSDAVLEAAAGMMRGASLWGFTRYCCLPLNGTNDTTDTAKGHD
jgi:hypothetical protein